MTYDEAVKIPERKRTSAQQRIVAEWEWEHAQKAAQQSEQAIVQTIVNSTVHDPALFEAYERFLVALAHIECAAGPYDPKVAQRDDHITYVQFRALPAKDRDYLTHVTDVYFQNHPDLSWSV
jgi:hypothetical protein